MAFVNLSMLLGGLFVAVPVVVHLTMRRKPQQQVFPALRFLKERRQSNQRQLQIRHWLLLSLRCALVGLLAAALSRPSVGASSLFEWSLAGLLVVFTAVATGSTAIALLQRRSWRLTGVLAGLSGILALLALSSLSTIVFTGSPLSLGDERAPVAAAIVVDTSPRMGYRFQNQTRVEAAREMALWLLRELPRGSEIAVIDSHPDAARNSIDLAAAQKAIERLETSPLSEPLAATVETAIQLVAQSDLARKEVYVFSDLTRAAWPSDLQASVHETFKQTPQVSVYVVDVGVEEPQNNFLGDLVLSAETTTDGSQLTITTDVGTHGEAETLVVELLVEEQDADRPIVMDGDILLPLSVRRDRVVVEPALAGSQRVQLQVSRLPTGVHQGSVVLQGSDGLPIDDVRYFAVEVRNAWPVLVSAPEGVFAELFVEAISPRDFRQLGQSQFDCRLIDQAELANEELSPYDAVCLLDPPPMEGRTWEQLAHYVADGGGLAIFLGHRATPPEAFNHEIGSQLVGGPLLQRWRAGTPGLFLAPARFDHPVLAPFRQMATSVPWEASPVYRHWVLDTLSDKTSVLIRYSNNQPALLETRYGQGRVLTLTTPVSDPLTPAGRSSWNELPTSENSWPYLVLANEAMNYLVGNREVKLNYHVGEAATLANPRDRTPERYRLFSPGEQPVDVTSHEQQVRIRFTEQPGAYRLKGQADGPVVRGFAVNVPASHTSLTRLDSEELPGWFESDRYFYARGREEILFDVGQARIGREFYPYLLVVLVLVVGIEQVLANRFYRNAA